MANEGNSETVLGLISPLKEGSAAKEHEELGFLDRKQQQYLSTTKKISLYRKANYNLC